MKTKEAKIKTVKIRPVKIKKRRLKYIAVLPSFITLMNGACGFISMVFASRSAEVRWNVFFMRSFNMTSFVLAGYMIFLAMIADVMDGRVARLTRTTSSFGGQLDSLSDAISFGAAPAFLMVKVVEHHIDNLDFGHFRFSLLAWRGIFFSAIFYAMCAIVRLARFNVENEENESAHMNFVGLPSPAAAGVIVSLVIIHQQILPRIARSQDSMRTFEIITIFVLPIITFLSGILMVSRIRYPHLANQLLRGKKSLAMLLLLFACGLFIIWNLQLAMVAGFCGFALFGVFRWLILGVFRKLRRPLKPFQP
jgi:CDP-diacylglycerol--serine O-phosphatidyltransferase